MNYSIYRFSLDIRSTQAQISLPITLGDTARRLYITFTDGGKPVYFADGCSASLVGVKADGKHILHDCVIEDNTTIRYDFRDSTATALGELQCQILFSNASGRVLGSPRFSLIVFKDLLDSDDVVSEDDVETLGRIVGAETARVNAEKARVAAEGARADAEADRMEAEQARSQSEVVRANAEAGRRVAEAEREKDIQNAISDIVSVKTSIEEMRDRGDFNGKDGAEDKLLVVTVEGDTASHTAAEIDEWANNGGMVVLDKGGFTYTLYAHTPTFARFRGWLGPDSMFDVAILAGNEYQSRTTKNIHLPTVTEEDNGKVLQVVDGTWQAASLAKYLGEYEVVT
jgi:hypothetical protein